MKILGVREFREKLNIAPLDLNKFGNDITGNAYLYVNHFSPDILTVIYDVTEKTQNQLDKLLDANSSVMDEIQNKDWQGLAMIKWNDGECALTGLGVRSVNQVKTEYMKAYLKVLDSIGLKEGETVDGDIDDIFSGDSTTEHVDDMEFCNVIFRMNIACRSLYYGQDITNRVPTAEEAWQSFVDFVTDSEVEDDTHCEYDIVDMRQRKCVLGPGNIKFISSENFFK